MNYSIFLVVLGASLLALVRPECSVEPQTKITGTHAPGDFCPGDLVFDENFATFDTSLWDHEISLYGGYNGEFQWYSNDPANIYTKDDRLFITPTLTYKYLPCRCESDLYSYKLNLTAIYPYLCHISDEEGCYMEGQWDKIINPIRSSKVKTHESFRLKYGKIEVKAKTPRGEFLWPAIWMMPAESKYGGWPRSGEIDIMESRGNDVIMAGETNIGNQEVGSTLHFGANHQYAGVTYHNKPGFHKDFHLYNVEWTPNYLRFQVDNFDPWYHYGPFQGNYTGSNSLLAPFDQEFYFILNLAVGGTNGYFPEEGIWYPNGKPYTNSEGRRVSQTKFWQSNAWKFYEENPEDASMQVEHIKVWAI